MNRESSSIRARERRSVVLGAIAMLALLAAKATPVLLEHYGTMMASDRAIIANGARMEAQIRHSPTVRDSLVARRVRLALLDSAVLDGTTAASGSASLAQLLVDASAIAKTDLGPVQLVSEAKDSATRQPFTRVSVRASLAGSVDGVMTFLAVLEQGPTLLNVRELSLDRGDAGPSGTRILRADILVDGLVAVSSAGAR